MQSKNTSPWLPRWGSWRRSRLRGYPAKELGDGLYANTKRQLKIRKGKGAATGYDAARAQTLVFVLLRHYPVKIYKQRIIGPFIADFYCASAKLVIEIDGSQHYDDSEAAYDAERTAYLESYGLRVIRYSNRENDREFPVVCQQIDSIIRERRS